MARTTSLFSVSVKTHTTPPRLCSGEEASRPWSLTSPEHIIFLSSFKGSCDFMSPGKVSTQATAQHRNRTTLKQLQVAQLLPFPFHLPFPAQLRADEIQFATPYILHWPAVLKLVLTSFMVISFIMAGIDISDLLCHILYRSDKRCARTDNSLLFISVSPLANWKWAPT